jgi:hypothetical protein
MFKKIITVGLLAVGAAQAADTCQSRQVPTPVIVDIAWSRIARFSQRYEDFYARCGSMIDQLARAERQSQMFLRSNNKSAAANVLITTLIQYAQNLPPEDAAVPYPITFESIRQGSRLAQTLMAIAVSSRATNLTPYQANEIKYNMISKIYQTIKKAYTELDTPYYRDYNRTCFGGNCVGISAKRQFNEYYDGVAELAKLFLKAQVNGGRAQGNDKTELKLTAASAKAAKYVLLNSVFARDYSCAILELHAIQVDAESFVCEGNPGYNQADFVDIIRESLAGVRFAEMNCSNGHHGHRGNWRGNGWDRSEMDSRYNDYDEDTYQGARNQRGGRGHQVQSGNRTELNFDINVNQGDD